MNKTAKNTVKRSPKRGIYTRDEIYEILDRHFLGHIGITHQNAPVVIPMMYGRDGDKLYIHGASVSRLMTELETGQDVCISVAQVNGLVLARSAFHHSLNYESVVVFGQGKLVPDHRKVEALKAISDHMLPGRWEEVREPSAKELKATKVIEVEIDQASAKVRTGDPSDDKADYELDIWAGVLPMTHGYQPPIADKLMDKDLDLPASIEPYAEH